MHVDRRSALKINGVGIEVVSCSNGCLASLWEAHHKAAAVQGDMRHTLGGHQRVVVCFGRCDVDLQDRH